MWTWNNYESDLPNAKSQADLIFVDTLFCNSVEWFSSVSFVDDIFCVMLSEGWTQGTGFHRAYVPCSRRTGSLKLLDHGTAVHQYLPVASLAPMRKFPLLPTLIGLIGPTYLPPALLQFALSCSLHSGNHSTVPGLEHSQLHTCYQESLLSYSPLLFQPLCSDLWPNKS